MAFPKLRQFYTLTLGFLTPPVTTLLILIYFVISLSVLITDQLPPVPSQHVLSTRYGGLNVTEAWQDLRIIAARPHPYNSHANDVVRAYLLKRVKDIREQVLEARKEIPAIAQTRHEPARQAQISLGAILDPEQASDIIIEDDLISNGTWSNTGASFATYFEGNNILVKIRGTSSTGSSSPSPAVLFSAHFDSVSTSSGATDDGMGVVTLLQLFRYFGAHPPTRTVIFNINNGEEDGLHGAHAFLEHPWVKGSSTEDSYIERIGMFVNLEGASEGGRPLMFRATSIDALRGWKKGLKGHPHANVISGEAFERGVVRSATDYSVYTSAFAAARMQQQVGGSKVGFGPMQGLDLSFYRGRAFYHTKFDRVAYTKGGERALWAMMENAWGAGVGLAFESGVDDGKPAMNGKGAVYFDLFNNALVLFPLTYLLTFNIVALVVGPITLILLGVFESALERSRRAKGVKPTYQPVIGARGGADTEEGVGLEDEGGAATEIADSEGSSQRGQARNEAVGLIISRVRKVRSNARIWAVLGAVWRHAKFWVALVVVVAAQVGLVAGFVKLNPFVVYSYPWISLVSSSTLSLLFLTLVLAPSLSTPSASSSISAWTQFRTVQTHMYIFTWILIVLSTIGITKLDMGGGTYFVSLWNGVVWVGCVVCAIAGCVGVGNNVDDGKGKEEPNAGLGSEGGEFAEGEEQQEEEDTNERTPLISKSKNKHATPSNSSAVPASSSSSLDNPNPHLLWILLLLILIPLPLILTSHIFLVLLAATSQTLADGSPAMLPYAATALLSSLCVLPLAPFIAAKRVRGWVTGIAVALGVVCTALAWVPWAGVSAWSENVGDEQWNGGLFPFREDAPLKVFFQQRVEVHAAGTGSLVDSEAHFNASSSSHSAGELKVISTLTGASPFLENMILPKLPSYLDAVANSDVECEDMGVGEVKNGLKRCAWVVDKRGLVPVAGTAKEEGLLNEENVNEKSRWDWTSLALSSVWFTARAVGVTFNRSSVLMPTTMFDGSYAERSVDGARFEVQGNNSRACRIYFDQPVKRFRVNTPTSSSSESSWSLEGQSFGRGKPNVEDDGTGWTMQRGYESETMNELRLWSRDWGKKFVVDVEWAETESESSAIGTTEKKATRTGRVACEWVEYESGMVGMGLGLGLGNSGMTNMNLGGKIPAYEEVLTFLPKWAVASKLTDGLVEVEERFAF